MPSINLKNLKLRACTVVVRPLRGDSEIVRSEKKYERHGFGEVIKARSEIRLDGDPEREIKFGDYIIYDDTKAVEFALDLGNSVETVELITDDYIFGVDRRNK